jgi:hypothetical protein
MSSILTKVHASEVVKKMEDGEFGDYEPIDLKSFSALEKGVASLFSASFNRKKPIKWLLNYEINLGGLLSISEDDLEHFAKCKFKGFFFGKLNGISEQGYEILSRFSAKSLELNGVQNISHSKAEKIAKFCGDLYLCGLQEIPEEVASALSKKRGKGSLDLGSESTSMEDSALLKIAAFQGSCLNLNLKELTDSAAEILAKHAGYLQLTQLESLSDSAAVRLSQHQGDISFCGLKKISKSALQSMAKSRYVIDGFFGDAAEMFDRFRQGKHDDDQDLEEDSSRWRGPLSLSIGFEDGSYVNANLTKGIEDHGVLEAILRCKKFLKKPKKEDGFVIGWEDLSDKSGGRLDQGDESSALMLFDDIENFMNKRPSKKTVKRNKK